MFMHSFHFIAAVKSEMEPVKAGNLLKMKNFCGPNMSYRELYIVLLSISRKLSNVKT